MENWLFVVVLSEWSVRISKELSQLTSNEANRLLEKLGTLQLQHIQDASGLDRQSNIALVKPIQSLWYQVSHVSQAITGFFGFHVHALWHSPHGNFGGPGLTSTSDDWHMRSMLR